MCKEIYLTQTYSFKAQRHKCFGFFNVFSVCRLVWKIKIMFRKWWKKIYPLIHKVETENVYHQLMLNKTFARFTCTKLSNPICTFVDWKYEIHCLHVNKMIWSWCACVRTKGLIWMCHLLFGHIWPCTSTRVVNKSCSFMIFWLSHFISLSSGGVSLNVVFCFNGHLSIVQKLRLLLAETQSAAAKVGNASIRPITHPVEVIQDRNPNRCVNGRRWE